jgi:hypothetical protein
MKGAVPGGASQRIAANPSMKANAMINKGFCSKMRTVLSTVLLGKN